MFLNQKMTSKFLKYAIAIIASGAVSVVVLYGLGLGDACSVNQIVITEDLKRYDQTKDSDLCSQINDKISQFDSDCKGAMEILDCG